MIPKSAYSRVRNTEKVKKGAERMVEHTAERLEKECFVVYDADQIGANMLHG
jgi:ribosomal protein L7Ae-like RNA K-turn-binding protein